MTDAGACSRLIGINGCYAGELSFVRRSGRLDARLQRAWDRYAGEYLLDVNAGEGSLDVRPGVTIDGGYVCRTWGNDNPLIVEIGTGQGENIVAAAAAHPDMNFLALEVYDPGVAHTMLLAGKQGLGNLRIAQGSVAQDAASQAPHRAARARRGDPSCAGARGAVAHRH